MVVIVVVVEEIYGYSGSITGIHLLITINAIPKLLHYIYYSTIITLRNSSRLVIDNRNNCSNSGSCSVDQEAHRWMGDEMM